MFRKTLGLALYRSGRPAEAIPVLERSLAAKDFASAPYDLFLLALCHAKQNEAVQARVYFDRAVVVESQFQASASGRRRAECPSRGGRGAAAFPSR